MNMNMRFNIRQNMTEVVWPEGQQRKQKKQRKEENGSFI